MSHRQIKTAKSNRTQIPSHVVTSWGKCERQEEIQHHSSSKVPFKTQSSIFEEIEAVINKQLQQKKDPKVTCLNITAQIPCIAKISVLSPRSVKHGKLV